jgi:hypothetical protein
MMRGSCLCGAIAFEATGQIAFRNCHCTRCRKAHGAAFASNLYVKPQDFRWLRSEDYVASYRLQTAQRFGNAFCRVCGSPMPRLVAERNFFVVPAGALDDDPGIRSSFISSPARWRRGSKSPTTYRSTANTHRAERV